LKIGSANKNAHKKNLKATALGKDKYLKEGKLKKAKWINVAKSNSDGF